MSNWRSVRKEFSEHEGVVRFVSSFPFFVHCPICFSLSWPPTTAAMALNQIHDKLKEAPANRASWEGRFTPAGLSKKTSDVARN